MWITKRDLKNKRASGTCRKILRNSGKRNGEKDGEADKHQRETDRWKQREWLKKKKIKEIITKIFPNFMKYIYLPVNAAQQTPRG